MLFVTEKAMDTVCSASTLIRIAEHCTMKYQTMQIIIGMRVFTAVLLVISRLSMTMLLLVLVLLLGLSLLFMLTLLLRSTLLLVDSAHLLQHVQLKKSTYHASHPFCSWEESTFLHSKHSRNSAQSLYLRDQIRSTPVQQATRQVCCKTMQVDPAAHTIHCSS